MADVRIDVRDGNTRQALAQLLKALNQAEEDIAALIAGATTVDGTSIDFNGSSQLRRMALTGDVAVAAGSGSATLASIIAAGGPTGASATVPVITYDAKGRLTAVSTATITPAAIGAPSGSGTSTGTNTGDNAGVTSVTGTSPIASSGGATPAISLNDTAVTPGAYGSTSAVGTFTVDAKGRLTAAANATITPASIGADPAGSAAAVVSDTVYGSGWNGVTDIAPSKNAVYDKIESLSGPLSIARTFLMMGA